MASTTLEQEDLLLDEGPDCLRALRSIGIDMLAAIIHGRRLACDARHGTDVGLLEPAGNHVSPLLAPPVQELRAELLAHGKADLLSLLQSLPNHASPLQPSQLLEAAADADAFA
eukprot:CAMPEP_0170651232 /NCGR_PEP_ID=MMETSP0224-20130122/46264_1 /TAXON_ID=285029 /ORGANISM="Togula jolla, Strain CCCM 725" /LENGTH=113 /DNA_ID=CAMNT_0010983023 /DNA_START=764 /DNA_END=1106 /DNA_ORIENTATION=+